MAKLLIVYTERGKSAAYALKDLIIKDKVFNSRITEISPNSNNEQPVVILWNEDHWRANQINPDGQVYNYTVFVGNVKGTKEIMDVATIMDDNRYGIEYGLSGFDFLINSNPKKLKHSKEEYEKFTNELNEVLPNRKKSVIHGYKKFLNFFKISPKSIREKESGFRMFFVGDNERIENQQLLFGINVFYKNYLYDFIPEENVEDEDEND